MKAQPIPVVKLNARRPAAALDKLWGKILQPEADGSYLLLKGAVRVENAVGKLLVCYMPRAISPELSDRLWPVLSPIKIATANRSIASGSERRTVGNTTYSNQVLSATLGAIEGQSGTARNAFCRLTNYDVTDKLFNDQNVKEMFSQVKAIAQAYEPERYAAQESHARKILPDWMIEGTAWTTLTVNNSYPTGVHTDKGDLDAGVSCLLCLRRGEYTGGLLTFPEWGVGIDLQDGDLLLMDAHEMHGNTEMKMISEDAERVSVVFYLRTNLTECGTAGEEADRREAARLRSLERREKAQAEREGRAV